MRTNTAAHRSLTPCSALVMTSPTLDVDAFLASHPHLAVAKAWRRGGGASRSTVVAA
jgi:hypothetical protein